MSTWSAASGSLVTSVGGRTSPTSVVTASYDLWCARWSSSGGSTVRLMMETATEAEVDELVGRGR